jgi:predicted glycosyltransferase
MTREAAYVGVPAVSLFRGDVGGVDRHLSSLGRLAIVTSSEELAALDLAALVRREPLEENPAATDDIVDRVARAVLGTR